MAVPVEMFLDWVEREEGKYEYDRGTIGMMVENTRDHALLVSRFVFALMTRVDHQAFDVLSEGFGVEVAGSVRYPDVLLQRREPDGKSRRSAEPVLIVEVLSRSSRHLDMVVKRDEYARLDSLAAYVVASQDEPRLWLWSRDAKGQFAPSPVEIAGEADALRVASLDLDLPLSELYRGIG